MRYEIWQPAAENERFAPGAFDRTIGTVVPVTIEGLPAGRGRVVAAVVADDGSGVTITYDTMDAGSDAAFGAAGGRSFSNGNGPGGCSNLNGNSPGAGSHPGVIALGPSFQGWPWPDGHWWHWR